MKPILRCLLWIFRNVIGIVISMMYYALLSETLDYEFTSDVYTWSGNRNYTPYMMYISGVHSSAFSLCNKVKLCREKDRWTVKLGILRAYGSYGVLGYIKPGTEGTICVLCTGNKGKIYFKCTKVTHNFLTTYVELEGEVTESHFNGDPDMNYAELTSYDSIEDLAKDLGKVKKDYSYDYDLEGGFRIV